MITALYNHNSFALKERRVSPATSNSIHAFYISILPSVALARTLSPRRPSRCTPVCFPSPRYGKREGKRRKQPGARGFSERLSPFSRPSVTGAQRVSVRANDTRPSRPVDAQRPILRARPRVAKNKFTRTREATRGRKRESCGSKRENRRRRNETRRQG